MALVWILQTKNCSTPFCAAGSKVKLEVVRELLNHGASVDIAEKDDFTPLNAAVEKGH